MKQLVIIGARGFGREIYNSACESIGYGTEFTIKGFLDDKKDALDGYEGYPPILDTVEDYNPQPDDAFVCALGSVSYKKKYISIVEGKGGRFINLVHEETSFFKNVKLGNGNVFCKGVLVSCDTKIGSYNTFNDFVSIGHDSLIGDFNSFMTAARISGNTVVGNENYFGVNSSVIEKIKIGNNTVLAAGSVLMRRTKDGYTYIGIPASALVIKK